MPHFLIQKDEIKEDKIELKNIETISHLVQSLRVKKGEKVKFIDECENVYLTEIKFRCQDNFKRKIKKKT